MEKKDYLIFQIESQELACDSQRGKFSNLLSFQSTIRNHSSSAPVFFILIFSARQKHPNTNHWPCPYELPLRHSLYKIIIWLYKLALFCIFDPTLRNPFSSALACF